MNFVQRGHDDRLCRKQSQHPFIVTLIAKPGLAEAHRAQDETRPINTSLAVYCLSSSLVSCGAINNWQAMDRVPNLSNSDDDNRGRSEGGIDRLYPYSSVAYSNV